MSQPSSVNAAATSAATGSGPATTPDAARRVGRSSALAAPYVVAAAIGAAVLMVIASWSAGALPVEWKPVLLVPAGVLYYLALLTYVGAWLVLGGRVLDGDAAVGVVLLRRLVVGSALPFLLAAPFGRDLTAYAAQGHLLGRGFDPYRYGPSAAPGVFAHQVSPRWVDSPAPYGPLWLRISQFGAWLSHGHPLVAELVLRLPAFAGLLLCCWALPVLAQRLAGRLVPALWLGLASPLVIVLGVGGGHNDLLMLGLALAGLALACRPGRPALAVGAAVAGLAVMIKSPAAIAVAFTVPVWLAANGPRTRRRPQLVELATACAAALGGTVVAIAVVQASTGLGLGWTRQVKADAQWSSWLSLPTAVSMLGKAVTGYGHVRDVDAIARTCRTVGAVIAVVVLIGLWAWAMHRAQRRDRTAVLGALAVALTVAALLAPSVQPWYYAWGLVVAGLAVVDRRGIVVIAGLALALAVMIMPSGTGWESDWRAPVVIVAALAAAGFTLSPRRPVRRRRPPAR